MSNFHAALEIGTTRTVLATSESGADGRPKITCHAEIPSTGIRKSQILNIHQASQSIHSVLQQIERKQSESGSRVTIGNTFLVVNGQHVKAAAVKGIAPINGKVGEAEIEEVLRSSRSIPTPKNRELLDIIDQDYIIDGRCSTTTPKGMSGHLLELNTLQISADLDYIKDARTAADAAHLEIREPLFAATCAADAVLEDREKKNGALVLDLGGGSTGYVAYSDGYPVSTGVIGVGGDHITNDIAYAFQTTNAQAEGLKTSTASATIRATDGGNARIKVEQGENTLMDNRTISRLALDTVVNARLMELFTILRETLESQGLLHRLHSGIILTGGGARMKNIVALAEQSLGTCVKIGRPLLDGLENEDFPAAYASIAGALLYAHRNYEERSFIDSIFGRFFQ